MFGLFRRQSKVEKLEKKYERLLDEAFKLSRVNRSAGDEMYYQAELVMTELVAEKGRSKV